MRERRSFRFAIIIFAVIAVVISLLIGLLISKSAKSSRQNEFAGQMSKLSEDLSKSDTVSTKIGKTVEQAEQDEEQQGFEVPTLNEENTNTKSAKNEKTANKSAETKTKAENTALEPNAKNNTEQTNATSKEKNTVQTNATNKEDNTVQTNSKNKEKNTLQTNATDKENNTVQTNATDKENNSVQTNPTDKKENAVQTNAAQNDKEEEKIEMEAPIKGEIIREFAKDSLVFSNTLQEWVTHNGVDIKADKTSVVKSVAKGTVLAIKNDPRYGLTVIINHDNGYQTIYSNLLTAEFVVKGEKVEKGQSIGTVGNSATFEIEDEYHLHFELLKDNEYLNPTEYMSF